jgi:hypothetical protein
VGATLANHGTRRVIDWNIKTIITRTSQSPVGNPRVSSFGVEKKVLMNSMAPNELRKD